MRTSIPGVSVSRERLGLTLLIVSLASALGPFSNTIYGPNMVALREAFQTTNTWVGATLSVFGFVLALSQLLAGPVADRFSAKRVLVGGLLLYSAASVAAYWANQIEVFLLTRALQAAGAATGLVVGGAIITDRYPAAQRGKAMGTLQMFNAIGGTMGPLAGSAIALAFVWQANAVALVVAGLAVAALAARYLPETAAPAQRLSLSTIAAVIRYPVTAGILLMAFVQYLGHFTFVAYMPVVLRERFDLPETLIGLFFLPTSLGVLTGSQVGGRLVDRYGARRLLFLGAWFGAASTALYAAVLLLDPAAWTFPALIVFQAGFALSVGLSVPAHMTVMVERFTRNRGAAVGTYASLRYFGGAAGPLVTGLALDRFGLASGFGTAAAILALGAAVGYALVAGHQDKS